MRRAGPWLAVLVVGAAALLWTQSVRGHGFAPDEELFVSFARLLAEHFPGGIVDVESVPEYDARGIQRLTILLLAWPLGAVGGAEGMAVAEALMCLAFASAAVPAYLLARGVGLPDWWALAGAALSIVLPWAVLSGSFLNESVAYPAAVWAVWAAWRACVVAGVRADLLALGLALVAGLARTNLVALLALAPVAVAICAPRRLVRDHLLLAVALVAGVLAVLGTLAGVGAVTSLTGTYETSLSGLTQGTLPEKVAGQLSRLVTGLAAIPAILGAAWIAVHLARPRAPERRALAVVAVLATILILLTTLYAAPEERYVFLVAPLLIVAALSALVHRTVPVAAVAVSALVAAAIVAWAQWPFVADPSQYLVDPAQTFLSRIVLTRVPEALVVVAIAAAGLALAPLAAGRRLGGRAPLLALAVLAAVGLAQLVQTGYVVTERAKLTAGPAGLSERAWVDEAVGGRRVALLADGLGNTPVYEPVWREVSFFNASVEAAYTTYGFPRMPFPRHLVVPRLHIDHPSGRLRLNAGGAVPRLWVVPSLFERLGLAGRPVARPAYLQTRLVRLTGEPRATFEWEGVVQDGLLGADRPRARLRVFPAAGRCVTVTLFGPGEYEGAHRYAFTAPGVRRTGAVRRGERVDVTVPLRPGTRFVRLRATGAVQLFEGPRVALQIAGTRPGC